MVVDKEWQQLVRVPENYIEMPPQMLHDMLCAIRSFDHIDDSLYLEDFDWNFIGPKNVEDLLEFDRGLFTWLELTPTSTISDFTKFRGYEWMCKAAKWLKKGVPPVVAITYKNQTQIGDGRGRINVANMAGLYVPLYHMKYKHA